MNKTIKKSIVLSAILTIMLCISLVAGATYALFTSESTTNVVVQSGKVNVVASIDESSIVLYSPTAVDKNTGTITNFDNAASQTQFYNGGTASVSGNEITLAGVTPGDKVTFKIKVKNNSNVSVKYRTRIACVSDNGLIRGLNVLIDHVNYLGDTRTSEWSALAANVDPATVDVSIELPVTAGNEYQDKTMTLAYTVEAVQGNAVTDSPATDIYYVYTAMDLMNFNKTYNKIAIMDDIDLTGMNWQSIFYDGNASSVTVYGNDHTITGLTAALFTCESSSEVIISDLTIDGANIYAEEEESHGMGAAFIAYMDMNASLSMDNCHVTNSTIVAATTEVNGVKSEPRAAGLVGYISAVQAGKKIEIKNCTVNNCTITGGNGGAGIVGLTASAVTIENCKILGNTAITCTEDRENGAAKAGYIVGTVNVKRTCIDDCYVASTVTLSNLNAKAPVANGLVGRVTTVNGASIEVDGTAYVSAAELKNVLLANKDAEGVVGLTLNYVVLDAWNSIKAGAVGDADTIVINGNGKTISGLTAPLVGATTYDVTIKDLSIDKADVCDLNFGNGIVCTAAFVAYADACDSVIIENCNVKNSTIGDGNAKYSGGFVGYFTGNDVTISGCKIESSTVKNNNDGSLGGIVGFFQTMAGKTQEIKNCKVSASLVDGKYTGTIVGTVNNGATLNVTLAEGESYSDAIRGRIVEKEGGILTTLKVNGVSYTA